MKTAMDDATRVYVRHHLSRHGSAGSRAAVGPEVIAALERLREEVRVAEGGGGMCGLVTEELLDNFGWDRLAVSYLSENGEVICGAHFVSVLADGTIVEPTADQFGEGNSVVILSPGDPGYGRYRPEFYPDFNPGTRPDVLSGWAADWTGEMNADAERRLRKERGFGWWVGDPAELLDYCRHQLELCEVRGGAMGYDEYILRNTADLEGRSLHPFAEMGTS